MPLVGVLLALGFWQLLWMRHTIPAYMLPSPASVGEKWWLLYRNGVLWHHTSVTLKEALLGFAVAFVVGVGLGYPLARFDTFDALFGPYVAVSQAMPVIAFAPLLVVWFGLGLLPKVIICALIVFFPILINTVVGLRSIDPTLIEATWSLGGNGWQTLLYVEIPLMLRPLLGGIKMGLTLSMTGAMVGEFVSSSAGLGYMMTLGRTAYDIPMVYVAALMMSLVATLGYLGVSLLERLLITWE
ncbi:MAG: ABC transporter permease [Thermomicrobiales bacterium]|nr:ABC transporter permease [Thermomicrobiales bacterium]